MSCLSQGFESRLDSKNKRNCTSHATHFQKKVASRETARLDSKFFFARLEIFLLTFLLSISRLLFNPESSSVNVDVTIVFPIQSAYMHNEALNANFTPMQAAKISFKEQRKKYEPHSINLSSGDVFLPFVLESVGSIHIEGHKFFAKVHHRNRHFYSQAMMISNSTRLLSSAFI